jgi:hypothetical protein
MGFISIERIDGFGYKFIEINIKIAVIIVRTLLGLLFLFSSIVFLFKLMCPYRS